MSKHNINEARYHLGQAVKNFVDQNNLAGAQDALTVLRELNDRFPQSVELKLELDNYERSAAHTNKITAIKELRARVQRETGVLPGLKEAKDAVEAYLNSCNGVVSPRS